MSGVRPFRFGGGLFRASSAADWAEGARLLEASGYDTMFLGDHFSPNFLAPVPALLAAAYATTRLRVSCTVFANDFRHPAALAKEIATLDMLSGGRVEFGIGAGWNKPEYASVGLAFESPSVRVSRLVEAVQIIKGLWGESPFSFAGQHYTIVNVDPQPTPVQRPRIPIFMGGGGKQLLSFAAREADIIGIGPRAKVGGGLHHEQETEACLAEKIAWVREAAGARFHELELAMLIWAVAITDDRRGAAERIAQQRSRPVEEILASPFYLIGTVDSIVDTLVEQRARHGISYISVFPSNTQAFAPVVARLAGH